MTWLQATRLVAGRELREAFRRKSLWIVFAILFIGSSVAMILPDVLDSGHHALRRRGHCRATRQAAATTFESDLRNLAGNLDASVTFRSVDDRARARKLVNDDAVDIAVVGSDPPVVIVRSGRERDAGRARPPGARESLPRAATRGRRARPGRPSTRCSRAPAPRVVEVAADDSDRRASAAILSLVLYLVLLLLMIQAANGVAIEKANRISEVLLAVVQARPRCSSARWSASVWSGWPGSPPAAIPVMVKAVAGGDLPAGLGPAILGGLPWMVLGLVLYLTTAGALGALIERQEEAGSVFTPLSLLLIGTYVLAQSSADGSFGAVLAIFPFTSPIVMPSRIALGAASTAEIVASLAVGIVTVLFVIRLGAAIYQRGIVHTGRRLHLGEVLRSP